MTRCRACLVAVFVLVGSAVSGCGGNDGPSTAALPHSTRPTEPLPLAVKAPDGSPLRLEAGRAQPDDDITPSWCLKLRYRMTDIVIVDDDGNRTTTQTESGCGSAPAPPVRGKISVSCDEGYVAVYGATRGTDTEVTLVTPGRGEAPAHYAALPPGAGFSGRSFIAVAPLSDLSVKVKSGDRTLGEVGPLATFCPPQIRGVGARPFAYFPE